MAVFQSIRNLFVPPHFAEPENTVPAPPTSYEIRPMSIGDLGELLNINARCFRNGENYTKHTFSYLLNDPSTVGYRMVTAEGKMAGFAFVMMNPDGAAHLTTIGIAPEHRRRGLGQQLVKHIEKTMSAKGVSTIVLEVRVSNTAAQCLYRGIGFSSVQRVSKYYSDGEDGYLMMKSLV